MMRRGSIRELGFAELTKEIAAEAMEALAIGVVAISARRRPLWANGVAQKIISSGTILRLHGDCIGPAASELRAPFAKAVEEQHKSRDPNVVWLPWRSFPLLLVPSWRFSPETRVTASVLLFSEPAPARMFSVDALQQMFVLTHAEAKLLSAFLRGDTLAESAYRLNVSINTLKSQARNLFEKLDSRRQVDVVRAVLANPVWRLTGSWGVRNFNSAT